MSQSNINIWKVLTILLACVFLAGLIVYLTLIYFLPGTGYAIDFPLITSLGQGILGVVMGVLIMIILVAFPIVVVIFVCILCGFGFGIGMGASPIGKAIIKHQR